MCFITINSSFNFLLFKGLISKVCNYFLKLYFYYVADKIIIHFIYNYKLLSIYLSTIHSLS